MADDDGVVAVALRVQRVAQRGEAAAELGERMEVAVGRPDPDDVELGLVAAEAGKQPLEESDVGLVLGGVEEALPEDPQTSASIRASSSRMTAIPPAARGKPT
jgi:hypothetical protein